MPVSALAHVRFANAIGKLPCMRDTAAAIPLLLIPLRRLYGTFAFATLSPADTATGQQHLLVQILPSLSAAVALHLIFAKCQLRPSCRCRAAHEGRPRLPNGCGCGCMRLTNALRRC